MTKPLSATAQLRARRVAPRLTIQTGPEAGQEVIITKEVVSIGRGEMCDAVIRDPLVSRRHGKISWDGAHCIIEDLGSTNGTFVNGQRLTKPRVLKTGDEVRVGDVVIVFTDPQATLVSRNWPALTIDRQAGQVFVNRRAVELSAKEYALLVHLYDHAGQVCGKDEIARAVWPEYKGEVFDYQIESLIKRLRQKLEPDTEQARLIVTVRGQGYRLIKT